MTAEVVVRGELEIRKGIDGMNLDDALMMLDDILMQVRCVGNNNLSNYMKVEMLEDFLNQRSIFWGHVLSQNVVPFQSKTIMQINSNYRELF